MPFFEKDAGPKKGKRRAAGGGGEHFVFPSRPEEIIALRHGGWRGVYSGLRGVWQYKKLRPRVQVEEREKQNPPELSPN